MTDQQSGCDSKHLVGALLAGALFTAITAGALVLAAGGIDGVPDCSRPHGQPSPASHGSVLLFDFDHDEGDDLIYKKKQLQRSYWHTETNRTDTGWRLTARCSWP